jgi:hypothetical protein
MALDAINTIKSTFGSLKTGVGMKILGLLFVVHLVNMGTTYFSTMGTGMMIVSGLISLTAAAVLLLITVGAFRSFDSGELTKDQYTNNIVWPLIRITGANAVTTIFAYGVALFALLPVVLVSVLAGAGLSSLGAGAVAGGSILSALLGIAGLVLAIGAFFYLFLMLTVSVPMIAIEDNRIFEALDRSVQRTKGEKISMFLAALPVGLIYFIGIIPIPLAAMAPTTGSTATSVSPVLVLLTSVVTPVSGTLFFSLLNQYHQALPE